MSNQNKSGSKAGKPVLLIVALISAIAGFIVWLLRRLLRGEQPQPKEVAFPAARVTVTVSPQNGVEPFVVERPIPPDEELQGTKEGNDFMPQLPPIINFEVVDETNTPITTFKPALKVVMDYTLAQAEAAKALAEKIIAAQREQAELPFDVPKAFNLNDPKPLVGFWNGSAWKLFTREKHSLEYSTNEYGGSVTLSVNDWTDPPIGWYPPSSLISVRHVPMPPRRDAVRLAARLLYNQAALVCAGASAKGALCILDCFPAA